MRTQIPQSGNAEAVQTVRGSPPPYASIVTQLVTHAALDAGSTKSDGHAALSAGARLNRLPATFDQLATMRNLLPLENPIRSGPDAGRLRRFPRIAGTLCRFT